jgi:hypothetical protein
MHSGHDAPVIESAEEFVVLRTSDKEDEYLRAASEAASDAVWFEVIDRYPDMRQWVAHNKTTSAAVMERLAADSDPIVRYRVAMSNRAEPAVLRVLANDPDESVRAGVARHRRAPADVLDTLRHDSSAIVRAAVAEGR